MEYILILLEGIITFISPCMLPMLPIYISYFAGQNGSDINNIKKFFNACAFVLGFTIVYLMLAIFSATLGKILKDNIEILNIVLGAIIILFGLNFMGILNISVINKTKGIIVNKAKTTFISSFIFGIIFSLSWTPCVGSFVGSALSLILINGSILKGMLLIFIYCLGLGIPFIISVLLIDKLKNTFSYIKNHYNILTKLSGVFLCIMGILLATGIINRYFNIM